MALSFGGGGGGVKQILRVEFFSPLFWYHGNFVKLEGLLARQFQGKPFSGWYLAKQVFEVKSQPCT
jgi:hypothetical protein